MKEHVEWLKNDTDDLQDITRCTLDSWLKLGRRKETIDNEHKFCHPDILSQVLKSKSIFDQIESKDMGTARLRSNPFEKIASAIFMNRAAVKMANMDSILDYILTTPVDESGKRLVRENDLLYFADVCAGPGGFSEYVLWRKKWMAKGFGFTLKKEKRTDDKEAKNNDFKLDDFIAGTSETFDPFYGVNDDGDIYVPENIDSFMDYVLKQTETGVHLMMADGGFDVRGKENIQEIMSKQLYLCQCIVALSVVREKGNYVTKLFDIFTPFSVGLIYLMFKCFEDITIIKPNTSRPANSERYLVCRSKKPNTDTIRRHLFDVNRAMHEHSNSEAEVMELVSHDVLTGDKKFFDYIYNSNNRIGENQIIGLVKIAAFYKDNSLREERQMEIRDECLILWKIPNDIRKSKNSPEPYDSLCRSLLLGWEKEIQFLNHREKLLHHKSSLTSNFLDVHDWFFVPVDTADDCDKNVRSIFLSRGGRDVVMYNHKNESWNDCPISFELSPNTLLFGEIVQEYQGEGRKQTKKYSFHIIDGIMLGGIDIRSKNLKRRVEMCQKFAEALNKPCISNSTNDRIQIRCKQLFEFSEFERFFGRMSDHRLKDNRTRLGYELRNKIGERQFFVPRGLLFLKNTKQHLQKFYSKSHNRYYYYDHIAKNTFFPDQIPNPESIFASFKSTFLSRKLWEWELRDQVNENFPNPNPEEKEIFRLDFNEFLTAKLSS